MWASPTTIDSSRPPSLDAGETVNGEESLTISQSTRTADHRRWKRQQGAPHLVVESAASVSAPEPKPGAGRWLAGRRLILDDTLEHTAWNRGAADRMVLLVTLRR